MELVLKDRPAIIQVRILLRIMNRAPKSLVMLKWLHISIERGTLPEGSKRDDGIVSSTGRMPDTD